MIDTLSGEVSLSKLFYLPSEKESTLKEKNLFSLVTNSFLLELIPFQKRIDVQESKQEVIKVVSSVRNGRKFTKCVHTP